MVVAVILAIFFHAVLLLMVFPSLGKTILVPPSQILVLKDLAKPAAPTGGGGRPRPAPPKPVRPKPKPVLIPIPDPTPRDPEPIRKKALEEFPQVLKQIVAELNLDGIQAPPGRPGQGGQGESQGEGTGTGQLTGTGPGPEDDRRIVLDGDGSGVTSPVPIVQTTPSYTDAAINAKVQGVVWLQAIIRKDGTIDSFKVIRGLGHGLEEQAIQEISTNWHFRPGMINGSPVDVLATIEVQFNLR